MRNYYNSQLCYYRHCIKYYEQRIKDLEEEKTRKLEEEQRLKWAPQPPIPTIKKLQEF